MKSFRQGLAGFIVAAIMTGCPFTPRESVYFVVSDPEGDHGDSYILPLQDLSDIAHARALIADPENTDRHIAVARIRRGAGNPPNRNLEGDGEAWSWHVSDFVGFADFTAEIYDGWPGYVEDNLDAWMDNTDGTIGFWSYTVTEELEPVDE